MDFLLDSVLQKKRMELYRQQNTPVRTTFAQKKLDAADFDALFDASSSKDESESSEELHEPEPEIVVKQERPRADPRAGYEFVPVRGVQPKAEEEQYDKHITHISSEPEKTGPSEHWRPENFQGQTAISSAQLFEEEKTTTQLLRENFRRFRTTFLQAFSDAPNGGEGW